MSLKGKKIEVVTMGCSKNRVDSEHLLKQLSASGCQVAPDGADLRYVDVDTLVINTCGFIQDAKEESIAAILEAVEAKKRGEIRQVVVTGCLSQRYMNELKVEIPEVDFWYGVNDYADTVRDLGGVYSSCLDTRRYLTTPSHYAYLKIAEGCNRTCSYCAIPGIRGKHVSIPMEKILDEAESLAAAGVKELIVIAQDTTYYGLDLYGKRVLAKLLEKLSEIKGIEWIRMLYSYPASYPEDVLEIMAASEKMCKYLDIPLQHSADAVLKAMRRNIDGEQTRALVRKMREKVPGAVIRTTMMVGHPGEGEAEFEDLLRFCEEYRIERLGAFTYSEEEGTWGATNLKDEIPEEVKQERFDRLMEVQAEISQEFNESRIGKEYDVMVDSYSAETGEFIARTMLECPEVDGEVLISADGIEDCDSYVGELKRVRIIGADEYDLWAELI